MNPSQQIISRMKPRLMNKTQRGDKMKQKSLYPQREAQMSPLMWTTMIIGIIIFTIIMFVVMQVPSLA